MTHKDIYKWFERYFELYAGNNVEVWFPCGKNTIRIRQTNGQEFIFTYNDPTDWRFETIGSFLHQMRKER